SPIQQSAAGARAARKLTLGPLADLDDRGEAEPKLGAPLSLADARALAVDALRKVRKGIDPARELVLEKRVQRFTPSHRIQAVFAEFMAKHLRKRKGGHIRETTRRETGRLLGLAPTSDDLSEWSMRDPASGVLARWCGRDVRGISKRDVLDLLDEI